MLRECRGTSVNQYPGLRFHLSDAKYRRCRKFLNAIRKRHKFFRGDRAGKLPAAREQDDGIYDHQSEEKISA